MDSPSVWQYGLFCLVNTFKASRNIIAIVLASIRGRRNYNQDTTLLLLGFFSQRGSLLVTVPPPFLCAVSYSTLSSVLDCFHRSLLKQVGNTERNVLRLKRKKRQKQHRPRKRQRQKDCNIKGEGPG